MAQGRFSSPRGSSSIAVLGITFVVSLVGGAAVSLVAFYLARYGPSGGTWSFRGNGALAAYTLLPVALAAGWSAVVFRFRGHADWLVLASGAGLIGLALALLDAILLPVFGRAADSTVGPIVLVALAVWTVAAPLIAIWVPASRRLHEKQIGMSFASAGIWLAGVVGGLVLIGLAFPAGS